MSENDMPKVHQVWLYNEATGERIDLAPADDDADDTIDVTWHPDGTITINDRR